MLADARLGSGEQLGGLLEHYKNYLRLLAMAQMEERLSARLSPSDIVQETFYEAHRDFQQFRGGSSAELLAWLRAVLVNNLHRAVEHHLGTEKRDMRREVSIERIDASVERSAFRLEGVLQDPGSSPSLRAQRQEREVALADELARLPRDYREVIVLRHLSGMPFEQIGERMNRSPGAVRMLWLRGVRQLREQMGDGWNRRFEEPQR
ncbi:ECF RNA polymerase sigma-E factor [Pirellulimonas nuda]|uniref:ECF RNA polymerase sigma-E factor n=1 Tax=Pirellulimonas nuda TaxID=2528009 RepID=A0A518D9U0_9BACT|nr:sigma-70 family RNA polymerase sigma factor [Pirellulimonas nuda]QDU88196.1 ECF RNA polymerase sigma-E factor [Pirellulimonas nuda]